LATTFSEGVAFLGAWISYCTTSGLPHVQGFDLQMLQVISVSWAGPRWGHGLFGCFDH